MSKIEILKEISRERLRQDLKWGGYEHDRLHSAPEWQEFMHWRLKNYGIAMGDLSLGECSEFHKRNCRKTARWNLVELAALAVAVIETLDASE